MRESVRRRAGAALVVLLIATSSGAAGAAEWQAFANPRFGFTVDVPAAFRAAPPLENGDGRRFTSPDGAVTIRAYGAFLAEPGDFAEEAAQTIAFETKDGLAVTYRAIGRDRYTISGLTGARIVYLHAVPTCGREGVATLRIDYPASLKARLDPLVAHMAASLRGSGGC